MVFKFDLHLIKTEAHVTITEINRAFRIQFIFEFECTLFYFDRMY